MIVIPHVDGGLAPEVRALGEKYGARFADVSGSDTAYYELLKELWASGETFTVIEQDLLPDDELLEEVSNCAAPWCAMAYVYDSSTPNGQRVLDLSWGLPGKYSRDLIRRHPDALDELASAEAAAWNGPRFHPQHWTRVGAGLSDHVLLRRGEQPHFHLRPARHLRLENVPTRVEMREPSQPTLPGTKRGLIYIESAVPVSRMPPPVVETGMRTNVSDFQRVINLLTDIAGR
jgi:hypothetical protein